MKFLFTLLLPWLVVSAAARRISGYGESPYERYEEDKAKVISWGYEQKFDHGGGYKYEIQTKISPKEESKPKNEEIKYEPEYKNEEPKYESKPKDEGPKEESTTSEGPGNESENKNVEPTEESKPNNEDRKDESKPKSEEMKYESEYKHIEPKYQSKPKSEGHYIYEGENKYEGKNEHEGYKYEEPNNEPIYRKIEVTGHEDKYDEKKEGHGLKYVKYEKYEPLILGRFGLGFDKRTASSTGLQQPLTVDYELVVVGRDYWGRCRSFYKDPAGDYIFCVPVRQ